MKKAKYAIWIVAVAIVAAACTGAKHTDGFVTVEDGVLQRNGAPYRFVGTNLWYGAMLGSEGQGGNRKRLSKELDLLSSLGISNVRVLVGADGSTHTQSLVWPSLQVEPGVYNDTILAGLDWLMKELGERHMTAVIFLNNAWEWSGGFGQYLEWAGHSGRKDPAADGYNAYTEYVSRFATDSAAQALFLDHVRFIVGRKNRYTGCSYSDDPTLMAWQLCNEPRAFGNDSLCRAGFESWISRTAALIKSLDCNHLVSVGSEGSVGCAMDMAQYERIHADGNIDYLTVHIWPMNWGWVSREEVRADSAGQDTALIRRVIDKTTHYLDEHIALAERIHKPLVVEEFGYARDGLRFNLSSSTHARNTYYKYMLGRLTSSEVSPQFAGINFWAWSGMAHPTHERWQPFDDYCGDPAQEEQGLFSVFSSDTTTLHIISAVVSQKFH